jgi:integrase
VGTLTFKTVEALREPGRYPDGQGLYLLVSKTGARSWLLRIQRDGKRRDLGLGGYLAVSLKAARAAAADMRASVGSGVDPVAEKQETKKAKALPIFAAAVISRHDEIKSTFKNDKHRAQWLRSLETYAVPALGKLHVDQVTPSSVRDALLPIWLEKPETARRVRQRIEDVLIWAVASGFRADVPALTAKALRLPKQRRAVEHFSAMPWQDVPSFVSNLRAGDDASEQTRLALELLILTAGRSGEIRGMTWAEVDLEQAVWRIAGARMKAGREHIVPLSNRAVELLKGRLACRVAASDLVFPGRNLLKPMSDMTLKMAVRRMGLDFDPHGFRSSFRDWVSDATNFPADLAEAALAHAKGDKTAAAYQRSSMLEKRRKLMAAWTAFVVAEQGGNVVPMRAKQAQS